MGSNDVAIIPPKKLPSILLFPKSNLEIETICFDGYDEYNINFTKHTIIK